MDWERSGFYPEYWECVEATNNLAPIDHFDWYMYLYVYLQTNIQYVG